MSDACSATDAATPAAESEPDSSRDDPGGSGVSRTSRAPDDSDQGPADLELTLQLQAGEVDPPIHGWLEPRVHQAAALAGVRAGSLGITLVDDPAMIDLHGRTMGDPTPTDILTFDLRPLGSAPADDAVDGDLVICLDEAVRQARERGHDARLEVLLYAVHGLLHLLGEDDREPLAYEQMHRREDELLTAMGLGPVFGDDRFEPHAEPQPEPAHRHDTEGPA